MCCLGNKHSTEEFRKRVGRKKTFWGYKIYKATYYKHLYPKLGFGDRAICNPGIVKAYEFQNCSKRIKRNKKYDSQHPSGIHVYLPQFIKKFRHTLCINKEDVLIRVTCHMDDLIIADEGQAVFKKIKILKKDWIKAGLLYEQK